MSSVPKKEGAISFSFFQSVGSVIQILQLVHSIKKNQLIMVMTYNITNTFLCP